MPVDDLWPISYFCFSEASLVRSIEDDTITLTGDS